MDMHEQPVTCICTASGDLGEMIEHAITKLSDASETTPHRLSGDEPPEVVEARDAWQQRINDRTVLEDTVGMPIQRIAEALKGL